jgi:hypothetical protein
MFAAPADASHWRDPLASPPDPVAVRATMPFEPRRLDSTLAGRLRRSSWMVTMTHTMSLAENALRRRCMCHLHPP